MLARNHQRVARSCWADVHERNGALVLVNYLGGEVASNDRAEEAVGHRLKRNLCEWQQEQKKHSTRWPAR